MDKIETRMWMQEMSVGADGTKHSKVVVTHEEHE